jgi:ADP-ribose pyrophosphatase YjhB (NUDIX family)
MKIRPWKKGIAIIDTNKEILVVRERGNRNYPLPGGKADHGETISV